MSTNVLVADDSGTMRKIIIRSLNAVGITSVVEAADGSQAVALFKPGAFDLVLTDWNMPGKSGLEVIREIRAQDAKVPIIMITTEAENGPRDAGDPGRSDRLPGQAVHPRDTPGEARQAHRGHDVTDSCR